MYTAQFSEFSYGYALTDNIMHSGLPATSAAPIFPSLVAEGSAGGGYDVKIPLHPVPIFLQFKIPQVVRRKTFKMPAGFTKPYLRMPLRTKKPNQHKLLRDLEASGKVVAYATPDFWETNDLDAYFSTQQVPQKTVYLSPSQLGPLDEKSHHVAYCPGQSDVWLFSEPLKLAGRFDGESFGMRISAAVQSARRQEPLAFLNNLSALIAELTLSRRPKGAHFQSAAFEKPTGNRFDFPEIVSAAREAAYLAQVRLGCALIITGRPQ